MVGSSLADEEREEIVVLLRENIEVFAWTPHEMLGVDPEFISHRLNVDKDAWPVVQRARRSAVAHADVIVEAIDQLLEADAIKEV